MIRKHQNSTLQAFKKHNKWSVCDYEQKDSFYDNKDVMTMKYTKDALINVKKFENTHEHLKHIGWHETLLIQW